MKTLRLVLPLLILAAALSPSVAAADETIAADPAAEQATAAGGTVVWVSGERPGQVLMQRSPDGVIKRVQGAPKAAYYRSIDLGRDRQGDLVLTYQRCDADFDCIAMRDDLNGSRSSFKTFVLKRCAATTAPAIWNRYAAYGLSCFKRVDGKRVFDGRRSGLYLRRGSGTPRRVAPPRLARRAGADSIQSVDIRGNRVAAVYTDISSFVFSSKLDGTDRTTFRAGSSEGDGNAQVTGLALGSTPSVWAVTLSEHAGDPNRSILYRNTDLCVEYETADNAAGPGQESGFPFVEVAVDGVAVYLVVPGTGIVRHDFKPRNTCA